MIDACNELFLHAGHSSLAILVIALTLFFAILFITRFLDLGVLRLSVV